MHFRYEDTTSCPGMTFAIGATFKLFTSSGGAAAGVVTSSSAATPSKAGASPIRTRTATLTDAALYWDTQDLRTSQSPPISFADMPVDALKRAFRDGIGVAMSKSVSVPSPAAASRNQHAYIAQPSTSSVTLAMNPDMRPGHPKLKASVVLNGLSFAFNYDQFRCATYLHQWIELHSHRPAQSPKLAPRHWWHYAVKCILGHRSGVQKRQETRWDFSRIHGASRRRTRYVELYKLKLAADAAAAGEDVGSSAASKTLPAAVARELDNIEVKQLTFEQALLYRFIAEVQQRDDQLGACLMSSMGFTSQ